ncbi:MAG: SDH family Clp fold serine proteinase [bacterium]
MPPDGNEPPASSEKALARMPNPARDATFQARRKVLQALARKRGSKVITIVHSKMVFGEESYEELGPEETEHILTRIHETDPHQPIDLILHTPGGMALAAEMIAMALQNHRAKVTVLVPFYAMSGGTLIALAADQILMEPYSVLGPVDPQIGGWPASVLLKVVRRKGVQFSQDDTIMYSYLAGMAVDQMKKFVMVLLKENKNMTKKEAGKVADFLISGYVTHDTPINYEAAKVLKLPVKLGVPNEVYHFFDTCAFGVCIRPMLVDYGKASRLKHE